jgi:hypothetical protein
VALAHIFIGKLPLHKSRRIIVRLAQSHKAMIGLGFLTDGFLTHAGQSAGAARCGAHARRPAQADLVD